MLVSCSACGGLVPDACTACLHCDAPRGGRVRRLARAAAAVAGGGVFLVTLAACYGAPRHVCSPDQDKDKDGYCGANDCDDTNPAIHAYAQDVPGDGIDQNCDGVDGVPPPTTTGSGSGSGSGTTTAPP